MYTEYMRAVVPAAKMASAKPLFSCTICKQEVRGEPASMPPNNLSDMKLICPVIYLHAVTNSPSKNA